MTISRRQLLASAVAAPVLLRAQSRISVENVGGTNVVVFDTGDGLILVDSGPTNTSFAPGRVRTVINTHYHAEQTGNNERFAAAGAKIIAHEHTLQWMSNDTWIPEEDRYRKAQPKGAWPTQTFFEKGSLEAGGEQISYGYLMLAHTNGDIYVHFKNANVLAVGGVASPVLDPELDFFTGAWIGGRVDAMDAVLALANDSTRIVASNGPAMTKAQFKAERDMMEEVRARLWVRVREGLGPDDMLKIGVLDKLPRTWKDPKKFLYDAAKGMWGHHNKLDTNVV
mgnify:CR=1 FL=1